MIVTNKTLNQTVNPGSFFSVGAVNNFKDLQKEVATYPPLGSSSLFGKLNFGHRL